MNFNLLSKTFFVKSFSIIGNYFDSCHSLFSGMTFSKYYTHFDEIIYSSAFIIFSRKKYSITGDFFNFGFDISFTIENNFDKENCLNSLRYQMLDFSETMGRLRTLDEILRKR